MRRQQNSRGFFPSLGKAYTSSRTVRRIHRVFLLSLICYVLLLALARASSPAPVVLAAELPATQRIGMAITAPASSLPPSSSPPASPMEVESSIVQDQGSHLMDGGSSSSRGEMVRERQRNGITATANSGSPASRENPSNRYSPIAFLAKAERSSVLSEAEDSTAAGPAPPASETDLSVDYSAIPRGYDVVGTRAVLEVASTSYPELTIVFVYPGSGDPLLDGIWQHFARFGYVAMTHEDNQDTRLFPCAPNCQFWNAAKLRDRGYSQGSVSRVMAHESVHNIQAVNDPELAIHINLKGAYGPATQHNWNYRALIEGHAELTGGNVGPSSYNAFEAYYRRVQIWAEANGYLDLFNAAVVGHWDAFLGLMDLYGG